jgi:hypothetical protein
MQEWRGSFADLAASEPPRGQVARRDVRANMLDDIGSKFEKA